MCYCKGRLVIVALHSLKKDSKSVMTCISANCILQKSVFETEVYNTVKFSSFHWHLYAFIVNLLLWVGKLIDVIEKENKKLVLMCMCCMLCDAAWHPGGF